MKKKYRIYAKKTTSHYIDVEAENKEEATEIAKNTDREAFSDDDTSKGEWEIKETVLLDKVGLYDIAILHDKVYIGLEDVSVTFHTLREEGYSMAELYEKVSKAVEEWDNDPMVIRERTKGRGYYPSEHDAPYYILVAKCGTESLNKGLWGGIHNYSDINNCERGGALCLHMNDGMEKIQTQLKEWIAR